jgi:hypothetical protein
VRNGFNAFSQYPAGQILRFVDAQDLLQNRSLLGLLAGRRE